jgi:hypothetical protein
LLGFVDHDMLQRLALKPLLARFDRLRAAGAKSRRILLLHGEFNLPAAQEWRVLAACRFNGGKTANRLETEPYGPISVDAVEKAAQLSLCARQET